jgi:ribonuclease Z
VGLRRLNLATTWGELTLAGGSRAGEGTLVLLPQLRLALDAGRPHRALPPMSTVVISHGHTDHLGGIAYWASQRFLQSMGPGTLLVPSQIASDIEELLTIHARLEGGRPYGTRVVPVDSDVKHTLRKQMELVFFPTDHWVPTLGTRLIWRRHRLRSSLAGLPGEEIASRRRSGERITDTLTTDLLSYCADSGPGLFRDHPEVLAAEVLLIECSFFRPSDRERAAQYGHMHLEDLLQWTDKFGCRHLVILHPSRRHRMREVEELLASRLKPRLECSIHHLMVDWD